MPRLPRLHPAVSLLAACLLSGCGAVTQQSASGPGNSATPPPSSSTSSSTTVQPNSNSSGNVHGGQQPVVGAHIYLFAANPAGYGSPSISLLDPTKPGVSSDSVGGYVLTDTLGDFNFSGDYACSSGQLVYALSLGGNPGLPNGGTNPAIALMSSVGLCPPGQTNFDSTPTYIFINELSTVASAYALAGFMTDATHLGYGSSNVAQQGLANAFLNIHNLVSLETGVSLSQTPTGGDTPQTTLNTLADILVPCVNSDGTSDCSSLFANAPSPAGVAPTDTLAAILNIAHNPSANVANLFGNGVSTQPFQPTLTAAPNDWTLAFTFYAEYMVGPYFPAIDSVGNVWVPNYANNSLTEFSPTGAPLSGAGASGFTGGGLNLPYAIAIDNQDNAWVTNYGPLNSSTVSKFTLSGTPAVATPYPCSANCFFPAFDAQQNLWISGTDRAAVLQPSGAVLKMYPTASANSGISIDSTGSAWTIGQARSLYRLGLPATLSMTSESVTSSSNNDLTPNAIDSVDNIWYVSNKNSAIGESDKTGKQISPAAGYTGGGLHGPAQIAIDGSNRVWVANRDGNSLSAFTNAGAAISPSTGYQAPGLNGPRGLAIDASGNVWLTNFTYNSITEFVGIATPVVTPISPTTHGQRP